MYDIISNKCTISRAAALIFNQLDKYNSTSQKDLRQIKNKSFIKGGFSSISQTVINDDLVGTIGRLRGSRRLILGHIYYLLRHCSLVYVKQDTIAGRCGVTRRTVSRAIAQFKELGLLDVGTRYKESCVYRLPEYIKKSSQLSTIRVMLCPEWAKYRIKEQSVSLNILGSILVSTPQDYKGPVDFSGGNQGYFVERVVTKKERKSMKHEVRSTMPESRRLIIAGIREWLVLSVDNETQLSTFEDEVLNEAIAVVKPRCKTLQHPAGYFIGTCRQLAYKRQQSSFFSTQRSTNGTTTTNKKNPIYTPYEPRLRTQENAYDAAANIEKNRQRIVDSLVLFMNKEMANDVVSRRVSYYLDIKDGMQPSIVSSLADLFHLSS